ncbi:hypothetical protein [Nocardia sp. NBC_00511]|uniref:hypothetical protein n=1 Tax=Nocardia sp. NBC_00511 TaxID=2903591 RepID=UPI0030DEF659
MKTSLNPLDYRPAEIAKALVALLTSAISVLGLVAADLTTGGLSTAASWVAGIAAALTAPLVFLKKAEVITDVLGGDGTE